MDGMERCAWANSEIHWSRGLHFVDNTVRFRAIRSGIMGEIGTRLVAFRDLYSARDDDSFALDPEVMVLSLALNYT